MLEQAIRSQQRSVHHHRWTIVILSVLVFVLSAFFYYKAPMQELISRMGIVLMIGGVIVRITIEVISRKRSNSIKYSIDARSAMEKTSVFYQWRKKIHGPVTITIVALYSLGFYMLTPEFATYLPLKWVIIMDVGYIPMAIILIFFIKKGINDEMERLRAVAELQEELNVE
ncbi:hypothetical protein C900_03452 [Fulvivirga imtechensis AK7]|uniref:Uncharacterized protein n=2 Tax=Fulvivirga TaxID=396811 RepID=L8JT63_9BACT|nr:hypothetical protein C900_03452 [Fulvivirga imtechensis AK7]